MRFELRAVIGWLECPVMRLVHFVAPAALVLACAAAAKLPSGPGVLFEGDSPYNHLLVDQDGQGVRRLYFEKHGAVQSAILPGRPLELELPYSRAAMLSLAMVPEPKRVLILGLGGGAMPMFLRALYPTAEIEIVDIDPGVVKVARDYFGFKEDRRMKAVVADGRAHVEASKPGWDLIFLDAYGKGEIPRHLATLEFLRNVRGKLAPGGLVVGNVWEPDSNPLYARMVRTYAEAFPELCVLVVPGSGNRIFFTGKPVPATDRLVETSRALGAQKKLPFELSTYAAGGCLREVDAAAELLEDPRAQ